MDLLERLSSNKGTVSSALGKSLAAEVLDEGNTGILDDCIGLASYEASRADSKHIRAGAAKVVEIVAEKRPELVAPRLGELIPALSVAEPQTRWMIIRVMGFCAAANTAVAREAVEYAEQYLREKEGLVIASSADLFLGDLGSVSTRDAQRVFPILAQSMKEPLPNEQDWLLEALFALFENLDRDQQDHVLAFAESWLDSSRKATQKRAKRILGSRPGTRELD